MKTWLKLYGLFAIATLPTSARTPYAISKETPYSFPLAWYFVSSTSRQRVWRLWFTFPRFPLFSAPRRRWRSLADSTLSRCCWHGLTSDGVHCYWPCVAAWQVFPRTYGFSRAFAFSCISPKQQRNNAYSRIHLSNCCSRNLPAVPATACSRSALGF